MVKYQLSIFGPNARLALEIPLTEEQVNTLTAYLGTPNDPYCYDPAEVPAVFLSAFEDGT